MVVQNVSAHTVCNPPVDSTDLPAFLNELTHRIINDEYRVSFVEAYRIAHTPTDDTLLLFHHAQKIRKHFRGDTISLCSIVNAKSGACSEDCTFCAQSARYRTQSPVYKLMKPEDAVKAARQAKVDGAESFGIVISGYGIQDKNELKAVGEIVKAIRREVDIEVHGSFGILSMEVVEYLRDCGVTQINHNLETSDRYYPEICTTHTFEERLQTLRNIRESGIELCSGGIFGMGEKVEDRIDMAFILRDLEVETVPLNFLHRIDGTPLENIVPLSPIECLMIIALYRFILPKQELKICGGRESNLRDFQSMIFFAGADSMMIGNYLTTAGREPELDWQMMRDLDLKWTTQEELES